MNVWNQVRLSSQVLKLLLLKNTVWSSSVYVRERRWWWWTWDVNCRSTFKIITITLQLDSVSLETKARCDGVASSEQLVPHIERSNVRSSGHHRYYPPQSDIIIIFIHPQSKIGCSLLWLFHSHAICKSVKTFKT